MFYRFVVVVYNIDVEVVFVEVVEDDLNIVCFYVSIGYYSM